ncbi:PREDICTED: EF-hand calcium-binding domain-containing protein 1 [Nipponia nippon]|uniref:EF-hand calcium-binding domain-containing protein 1 n=1 Tax=Nipponia nippon TaxID=128390 RepID=UPI0005113174|nr:PREDICTED: EF-hand calcium-binding domain-containing protein 1 [Nipponia nippon]
MEAFIEISFEMSLRSNVWSQAFGSGEVVTWVSGGSGGLRACSTFAQWDKVENGQCGNEGALAAPGGLPLSPVLSLRPCSPPAALFGAAVNKSEVECLIKLFDALVAKSSSRFAAVGFDRNMFRDTLHSAFGMTDDMIMDRDSFEVYDLNGDGYISREEMFQMLKNSLLKQPSEEDPDEGIKDLVDIALKKMDYDRDGKLSFMDFEKAVRDENLLLEAFGPCLPDIKSSMVFEQKTFQETRKL